MSDKRIFLKVTGMSCDSCASRVRAALTGIGGVIAVTVDRNTGQVELAVTDEQPSLDHLLSAVAKIGYHAEPSA
jgi:mercuric reductase